MGFGGPGKGARGLKISFQGGGIHSGGTTDVLFGL